MLRTLIKDKNYEMDLEIDDFFQDVAIEEWNEVLYLLWNHHICPKETKASQNQVLKVFRVIRHAARVINIVEKSYRDGETEYSEMTYHIKPLSDNHFVEGELDNAFYVFLSGAAAPDYKETGLSIVRGVTDMLYHVDEIIHELYRIWVEYVKIQDALEATESNLSPVYCHQVVYK